MAMQCNNRLWGRTTMILTTGCAHSVGVIEENADKKSKSLLFPEAVGGSVFK